jgi:hypothetical protein
VDLEVEVAADGAGVAGLADEADRLTGPNTVAAVEAARAEHVGVEEAAALALAVDQQVVAVEDRVVAAPQQAPGRNRYQRRAAGGDDVEAFVGATAASRGAELPDRPARPVRPANREDMRVELGAAVPIPACRRIDRVSESGGDEESGDRRAPPQWCSMTRSTRLYSFASSALMK